MGKDRDPLAQTEKMLSNKKTQYILLGLIVVVGMALRFYGLTERGFILWDESTYARYALFGRSCLENLGSILALAEDPGMTRESWGKILEGNLPIGTPKPGHTLIMTFFTLLIGKADYACFIGSAILGVVTIVIVYYLVRDFLGAPWGLLSAFFLAISPFHIIYSRSSMAETDTCFFLVLSLYLFFRFSLSNRKSMWCLAGSGFALGLFVICNHRWIYLAPLFVGVVFAQKVLRKDSIRGVLIFFASLIFMPVCMDLLYIFGNKVFSIGSDGYFSMLIDWYSRNLQKSRGIYLHALYWDLLSLLQGKVFLIIALFGTLVGFRWLLWNKTNRSFLVLLILFAWIPLTLFSLKTRGDKLVAISIIAPFLIILFTFGIHAVYFRLKALRVFQLRTFAIAGLICLLVYCTYSQLAVAGTIINRNSGYREALLWLKQHGGMQHFSTNYSISSYYVGGRGKALSTPMSEKDRKVYHDKGYRFLLMDIHEYYHGPNTPRDFYNKVKERLKPVKIFRNSSFGFFPYIVDDFHYRHFDKGFMRDIVEDPNVDNIRIYDLGPLFNGNSSHSGKK